MNRWWPRDQQRSRRKEKAAKIADRLLGKQERPNFFSGTEMRMPIQYGFTPHAPGNIPEDEQELDHEP